MRAVVASWGYYDYSAMSLHEGHLVAVRIGDVDDLYQVGDDHRFARRDARVLEFVDLSLQVVDTDAQRGLARPVGVLDELQPRGGSDLPLGDTGIGSRSGSRPITRLYQDRAAA